MIIIVKMNSALLKEVEETQLIYLFNYRGDKANRTALRGRLLGYY
jgi:hypothetical protein